MTPEQQAIITGYQDRTVIMRDRLLNFVGYSWDALEATRDAEIAAWVRQVVPVVTGAQQQMGVMTAQYLAAYESAVTGEVVRPAAITAAEVSTAAVRGVPAAEVYTRPGVTVWTALSNGTPYDLARQQGRARALSIARTDVQLAKTHATTKALGGSSRVVGYRRVLDGRACALCSVASTQRYHKAQLLPIHPGCGCDVAPIIGEEDPGRVINQSRLDETHAAVAEQFGAARSDAGGYSDLIVTHDHGELGPVLSIRGQHFTGPDDLAA